MKAIVDFLRWKWDWAAEKPLNWAFVVLAVLTIGFVFWWPGPTVGGVPSDARLRAWSLALQLLGAAIVWRDLTSAARQFGKQGIFSEQLRWLRDGLRRHRPVPEHHAQGFCAANFGMPKMVVTAISGPNTVEGRIAMLEQWTRNLQADLQSQSAKVGALQEELGRSIEEERIARKRSVDRLGDQIHEIAVGNFSKLVFGAWWVAVGTVLSALAPEIVRVVAGQWRAVLQGL